MYLKGLEMQGFKSFADKTILEFKPGITTVIGPNGSGKSNISDSIRWVLGEQSMKSLRGAKSEDIIFAGTQNRKSLGFAEASIIIDNSDGKLPIEYSEVKVTRKIYRSGETGYFINKVPCRLKDILELFMDTGIGKDGYSIIGQGKINDILSNKSEDRRHIFEEAAGIVKYRVRKVESEKKLEQTKLNLFRINDILIEIEGLLDPLKIQSEKAKKFLDLKQELKNVEVGLFVYNIESYKEKLKKVLEDQGILKNQVDSENEKIEEIKSKKESLKLELDNIIEDIERMQNIGSESSNKIEKINSEVAISTQRIENNRENKESYINEIDELKEKIENLQSDKNQKIEKKNSLFLNKEKFEKELKEKEEELRALTEKLSSKEIEIEDNKKQIEDLTEKKYDLSSQIATQDANFENYGKRQKVINQEIQNTISELDAARITKQGMSTGFYEIEAQKNKLEGKLEGAKKERQEIETKMKEFDNEINSLLNEFRMKQSRHNFLVETEKEKEGYIKSVKELLIECDKNPSLKRGVNGVLANLIEVDDKYQTAIEMCLGASIQNIVTDTEEDAKKLVEHLRKNKLGRASFLPISSVRGKKIEKYNASGIEGIIGIASNLVKCDRKYQSIIENLLGRTVIVQDMDAAIMISKKNNYSFRVVTLNGDIINPSGAITGGSVAPKTLNILGRSKEIENLKLQMEELSQKVQKVKSEKSNYEKSIIEKIALVEEFERELQEKNIVFATENQKMVSINEQIQKIEIKLNKYKEELSLIESNKKENIELRQRQEKQIKEFTNKIDNLRIVIEEFSNFNKDEQKYIDDLNFDITNLKISVSSFDESQTSIEEFLQMIIQEIDNCQNAIKNKAVQIENIEKDNIELTQNIQKLKKEILTVDEEVKNSSIRIEELKKLRVEKDKSKDLLENQILEQFKVVEEINSQLMKLDVKRVKIEDNIEEAVNYLWNEYELTPNNIEGYKKPNNIIEAGKVVNKLRADIRDLGSINVDSIEEYRKTKERYEFMCEQRLDLENSATKLRNIIKEMTSVMKKQFSEKFQEINKNFNEVFIELFGGGRAELILQDEENILECGIDIQAQPTGKKLQNMMLLSGGEKAFTAIALLFAILKINPAPFCVLDEIEAALDDVNVYRFAEYLKKFSDETQFLVITHRKGTMEAANTVYGITMEENGISKLLSIKLN
ncbi:MAG: chromosome segregation protein SMC [Clostridia bacterium]|nr:chromosome segregation protein SMC [Clostridia bacterium]